MHAHTHALKGCFAFVLPNSLGWLVINQPVFVRSPLLPCGPVNKTSAYIPAAHYTIRDELRKHTHKHSSSTGVCVCVSRSSVSKSVEVGAEISNVNLLCQRLMYVCQCECV